MAKTLTYLIAASNNGVYGVAGQGFRANVVGAANDFGMAQYLTTNWDITGTTPAPDVASAYTDNTSFAMNVQLTGGAHFTLILATNAVRAEDSCGLAGFSSTAAGSLNGSGYGVITTTVRAPFAPGATSLYGGCNWTSGTAPAGTLPESVTARAALSGAPAGSHQLCSFDLVLSPNTGGYSDTRRTPYSFYMQNRSDDTARYDWQWSTDSGFVTIVSTSPSYIFDSSPATTYYFYWRNRLKGYTGAWSGDGGGVQHSWTDPRAAA